MESSLHTVRVRVEPQKSQRKWDTLGLGTGEAHVKSTQVAPRLRLRLRGPTFETEGSLVLVLVLVL